MLLYLHGVVLTPKEGGFPMSLFLVIPILAATGLYNPHVVDRHNRCIAEAGTVNALYCPAPTTSAPTVHHRHAKK